MNTILALDGLGRTLRPAFYRTAQIGLSSITAGRRCRPFPVALCYDICALRYKVLISSLTYLWPANRGVCSKSIRPVRAFDEWGKGKVNSSRVYRVVIQSSDRLGYSREYIGPATSEDRESWAEDAILRPTGALR
jgi:hypothetical protein